MATVNEMYDSYQATQFLKKLSVPENVLSWVEDGHVSVEFTATAAKVSSNYTDLSETVPFNKGVMALLANDTLGKFSKEHLCQKIVLAIKNVWGQSPSDVPLKVTKAKPAPKAGVFVGEQLIGDVNVADIEAAMATLTNTAEKLSNSPPAMKKISKTATAVMKEQLKASAAAASGPVPLIEATEMYQPVGGTSHGSEYYVVAIAHDLKVAARAKNGKLSFRVEGNINEYSNALLAAGLNGSDSHYSIHLDVGDLKMAKRTIGALLMDVGAKWETTLPDLSVIYGKGA